MRPDPSEMDLSPSQLLSGAAGEEEMEREGREGEGMRAGKEERERGG